MRTSEQLHILVLLRRADQEVAAVMESEVEEEGPLIAERMRFIAWRSGIIKEKLLGWPTSFLSLHDFDGRFGLGSERVTCKFMV